MAKRTNQINNNNEVEKPDPKYRIHRKCSKELLQFLKDNNKEFYVDKTSTGFPTYNYKNKSIYIRNKKVGHGAVNKINEFQNQVANSGIYKFLSPLDLDALKTEADQLDKSLMSKGFFFNPIEEKEFRGVIKIDANTAYWQTCRYMRLIDRNLYRNVVKNCIKETRLKMTGTLGKVNYRTPYVSGKGSSVKGKTFIKDEAKRRIIFRNIYQRIRKFVDEIMVWCWMKNPQNFIGFYVDCIWLREYDHDLILKIENIFDYKMEFVDLKLIKNDHGKLGLSEIVLSGVKKGR